MLAVVLGTALSAFGANELPASEAVQDLGKYCTTCWRNARLPVDSWGDCTQDVFCRMLQRIPSSQWDLALQADGEERREFLRAIDAVKKRVQRARRYSDPIDPADPRVAPEGQLAEDRETVRLAAEELLSQRQQWILQLSFEGWSVQDISAELDMPVERVSDEKYKAVRKLRAHLAEQDG